MPDSANAISQHVAEDRTTDRLISLLETHLPTDLDTLFARDLEGMTGAPGAGQDPWTPGIYLPNPDVYYRQAAPTSSDDKGIGDVIVYVGPIGRATQVNSTPEGNYGADGVIWQMEQEFAVSLVFGLSAGQEVAHDLTLRQLRPEEIVRKRASYYAGALAHTVFSRAFGSLEIWGTKPGPRSSGQAELPVDGEEYVLVGISSYEFAVVNNQLFPAHVR
jgi:hypothetical protein